LAATLNWRLVRYVDNFVLVVSGTKAQAETLREEVTAVLATMGLRLSDAKTRIVHIDEGFDFLVATRGRTARVSTPIGGPTMTAA
jgi:hypothetical protein